jgi:transposase-like protein
VVVPGEGGWAKVRWRADQEDELVAYVRFERADEPHRLKPAALLVTEPWLRLYRDVPLPKIENAVHADPLVWFELRQHIDVKVDDPILMFEMKKSIERGMSERFKLERPAKRRLDDAFYANVAQAYADAVAWGMNPRKTLAADSGIPADTVARWIRTARQRKKLSPAQRGKASGVVPGGDTEDG